MQVNNNPAATDKLKDLKERVKLAHEKAVDQRVDKVMRHLDRDKDGQIGAEEATRLRAFDANHDGKVDADEAKAGIQKLDKNADGGLDREELKAGRKELARLAREDQFVRVFAARDDNDDNVLTGDEIGRYRSYDEDCDGRVTFDEYKDGKNADREEALMDRFNDAIQAALEKKTGK